MYSIFDFDRYGYYLSTDKKKFYNKLECILHCKSHGLDFSWCFNNNYFDLLDWSVEPKSTIQDLYAQRAQELRDKYDYLVLHLSGGHDSGNILQTFAVNDIKLDEVIARGPFSDSVQDPKVRSAQNTYAEIGLAAVPAARIVKEQYQPDLKITVVETKQLAVDIMKNNTAWFEGYNDLDPGMFLRATPNYLDQRYTKMVDQGKTVAHITGIEKPKFFRQGNSLHMIFDDESLNRHNPLRNDKNNVNLVEHFYWAPSTGNLVCKQGHLILKALNSLPNSKSHADKLFTDWSSRNVQDWLASVIYPKRFLPHWDCEKSMHGFIREWDSWFYRDENSDFLKIWRQGMQYLNSVVPIDDTRKNNMYVGGFKPKFSPVRYLGEICAVSDTHLQVSMY